VRWSSSFSLYLSAAGAAVGWVVSGAFPISPAPMAGAIHRRVRARLHVHCHSIPVAELAWPQLATQPSRTVGEVARRHGLAPAGTRLASWDRSPPPDLHLLHGDCRVVLASRGNALQASSRKQDLERHSLWSQFLANPIEIGLWHLGFLFITAFICARGVNRGIEVANKIRAPACWRCSAFWWAIR